MSHSGKVSRTFEFLCVFGAAEKSQGAAEKNKEKVKVLSRFLSQSVKMFCQEKEKIQNVDNFFPKLEKNSPKSS